MQLASEVAILAELKGALARGASGARSRARTHALRPQRRYAKWYAFADVKSIGNSRTASNSEAATEAARFWLRSAGVEVRIEEGETLIGRGDNCQLRLPDPAVSREHAKVTFGNRELLIEDLSSANGVFVNEERIRAATRLWPGDRIAVGHSELIVYSDVADVDVPTELTAPQYVPSSDRAKGGADANNANGMLRRAGAQRTQSETRRSFAPNAAKAAQGQKRSALPQNRRSAPPDRRSGPPQQRHSAPPQERHAPPPDRHSAPPAITQQAETLDYVGRMVEKMFASGRMEAAKHLLSSHLQEVFNAARICGRIDSRLADVAGRYAVRLANETLDSYWIDLCIELHIIAAKLMMPDTVEQLVKLREKAPLGSRRLLREYELLLRAKVDRMTPADRALVARIACL